MFAWNTRVACHDRDVVYTLRSPCSWKLQCEMYVLQFYLNLFSVVLAQLRLTLRCRCIDASTSKHAHLRRSTSPPHHTHTSAHLYITSVHPHCRSFTSVLSFFLAFYISFLSSLCIYIFARSHRQIYISTSIHLQIYIAPAHPHCHSFTSTLSFSLYIHLFDSAGQLHVSLSGQPFSSFFCFLNILSAGHNLVESQAADRATVTANGT